MLKGIVKTVRLLLRAWRMAHKRVDVLMRPFAGDVLKRLAVERESPRVRTLILGSSHAYSGYLAGPGEFNLALRSCDLYHAWALHEQLLRRRWCPQLQDVVLFYDVFSPGFVMEKTSRGSLAIPYFHLWGIPHQAPLALDHRAVDRRVGEALKVALATVRVPDGYLGNQTHEPPKKTPELQHRLFRHLQHNRRPEGQTRYVEKLATRCRELGRRLAVVLPPVRADYAERLPAEDVFAEVRALASRLGFRLLDLTRAPEFGDGDFLDSDHLSRSGAEKLTRRLRRELGLKTGVDSGT